MTIEPDSLYDSIFIKKHQHPFLSPLFHYTKEEASEKIIANKKFHFSKYDKSNDKFEFSHGLSVIEEILIQIKNNRAQAYGTHPISWDRFLQFFSEERTFPKTFYYMGSFTVRDNKHLWKKYAENRKGRRLTFQFDRRDFTPHPFVPGLVQYSPTVFKKNIHRIVDGYDALSNSKITKWKENGSDVENMRTVISLMIRDLFVCAAFFKKPKHSIENEYRIVIWGNDQNKLYEVLSLKESHLDCCDYLQK